MGDAELHCPKCGSRNCECQSTPHVHRCLDCGYDGTAATVRGEEGRRKMNDSYAVDCPHGAMGWCADCQVKYGPVDARSNVHRLTIHGLEVPHKHSGTNCISRDTMDGVLAELIAAEDALATAEAEGEVLAAQLVRIMEDQLSTTEAALAESRGEVERLREALRNHWTLGQYEYSLRENES